MGGAGKGGGGGGGCAKVPLFGAADSPGLVGVDKKAVAGVGEGGDCGEESITMGFRYQKPPCSPNVLDRAAVSNRCETVITNKLFVEILKIEWL